MNKPFQKPAFRSEYRLGRIQARQMPLTAFNEAFLGGSQTPENQNAEVCRG